MSIPVWWPYRYSENHACIRAVLSLLHRKPSTSALTGSALGSACSWEVSFENCVISHHPKGMQLQCFWEQEANKEGHQQPTSQVLSILASFGVDATPQTMDQENTGVNIAAEQGTQEPSSGYHLARALLFSKAKCTCCVLISYLCWNTVSHWCFWKILTLPQHRSITKDRKH